MEVIHPTDLDEALAALAAHPEAVLLAGGTDLMVEVNFDQIRPEKVILLRRLAELQDVSRQRIGAGVTFRRLESGDHQALAQLARTIGSPQIRAAGTLGGNIGTASPAGDALPFLAGLDAEIELSSKDGTRRVRWDRFFLGVKQTALRPGELITAVILPTDLPDCQEFAKIGQRSAMVISIASACVFRWRDGRTRVAMGSVGPTPIRARQAEEMMSAESNPGPAALQEFARLVSEEVRPISDHRGTADYRRHASGVLARRLLERCLAK
ncbi:MAG: xanthine dehydrogenase family protein subunit M [Acidimicrobiia bacterium]|nr:xanthine dehydrogenase family protein subunit M [Acidimicrobiia bacterium]MYD04172.1 xanthine dehydrogenase family protein subunit M [Acidimicrobiia bacterium]